MSDNSTNMPLNIPLNDITNILQDYISNQMPNQMPNPTIVFPTGPLFQPIQQSWGNNTGAGHFGIGMHSAMNHMNPFGNTFDDILQRSMDESDYPNRPTDKDVVDKLPIVEILNDTTQCAICQDTLVQGTNAIKLPCSDTPHYFCIGDSPDKCEGIIPWLEEHNTCPVCRFELPEQKKEEEEKEEEEKEEPPDLEEITESADTPNVIEPITVPMPPIPITPLTSLINTLLQQEMSNLDDEGFDMREYEEAIHRSLDGRDATAQEAASGDIEEKNNDDAGTDSD